MYVREPCRRWPVFMFKLRGACVGLIEEDGGADRRKLGREKALVEGAVVFRLNVRLWPQCQLSTRIDTLGSWSAITLILDLTLGDQKRVNRLRRRYPVPRQKVASAGYDSTMPRREHLVVELVSWTYSYDML